MWLCGGQGSKDKDIPAWLAAPQQEGLSGQGAVDQIEMGQLMVLHRTRNGHRRDPLPHAMAKHRTSYSRILPDQRPGWGWELILSQTTAPGTEQVQWPGVPACPLPFPCGCWCILEWGTAPTLGGPREKVGPLQGWGQQEEPQGAQREPGQGRGGV